MAETVKKSRIVSDEDNLEESLLEEFNMRLKNCMSQDDIKNEAEDAEEHIMENSMYENVEAVKITQQVPKSSVSSSDFIQSEIESYYDEPRVIKNGNVEENGDVVDNVYENLAQNDKTDTINDQYLDMVPEKTNHLERPTIECNEYEEMGENNYETVEDGPKRPSLNLPATSLTESDNDGASSVKDRMFLSTDDTSCLLFTQTVTSPMLTPSEENIDFLKGFRRESTNTTSSDGSPKNDKSAAESTDVDVSISEQIVTDLDENKEVIYENLPNGKVCDEVIYENLKEEPYYKEPVENIYQNIDEVKSEPVAVEDINKNRESLKEFESLERHLETLVGLETNPEKLNDAEVVEDQETIHEDVEDGSNHIETVEVTSETIKKEIENLEKSVASVNVLVKSEVKEKYSEFIHHNRIETSQNYLEKYSEVVSKNTRNIENKEKDTETVPDKIVQNLMSQFSKTSLTEVSSKKEFSEVNTLKNLDIMKQINKFEKHESGDCKDDSTVTESYSETTTIEEVGHIAEKGLKKKKSKKARKEEKENISVNVSDTENSENFYNVNVKNLKSSFNKFDALQKKNVLHVRSSDAAGAQDKFNGAQIDTTNCKACSKTVFQMEQIKAEKAIWHKNCFRCTECNKQLTVDTYQSHEGNLYCKPHFRSLFAPRVVEEDQNAPSDKPDLGLEELQSLNVKERFQVFEQYQDTYESEKEREPINVKRSPSILSKLARFQAKGMDVGVADDSLNGIPIEESTSEEEEIEEEVDGEDADLVRAKKVQKEKPFHFTGMSDVKSRWENGEQNGKDERREERKQEIQSIRNRLFMGKQGKMKEMYQQAVMESESTSKAKTSEKIDFDAKSIKDKFEKGELINENQNRDKDEEEEVYESEISKKSRSLFLELDANASKAPQMSPVSPPRVEIKKAREAYLNRVSSEDTVKSGEVVDDIEVKTADIQERFKFFETYREPEKDRKQFRITPPREGQVKAPTPEREVYRDPDVVRSEEFVEDSVVAKASHTATKMLSKFRQMEENLSKEPTPQGPKPLKRFTPPPEPTRQESSSDGESGTEEESEQDEEVDHSRMPSDLVEAQKAARAKQLRAKFEKWEEQEIRREQTNSVNIVEESGEEQSQVESTKSLRARFENMRESSLETRTTPKVKVNRFVDVSNGQEMCQSCKSKVYPLEKISVHGQIFHKNCFKCMECNCVLRMDSYTYNQGLLYCIPHFKRLFISKGNYESGFGLDQHKDKWSASPNTATMA